MQATRFPRSGAPVAGFDAGYDVRPSALPLPGHHRCRERNTIGRSHCAYASRARVLARSAANLMESRDVACRFEVFCGTWLETIPLGA